MSFRLKDFNMLDKKLGIVHTEKLQATNYIKASTSEEVRKEAQKLDREFFRKSVEMRKEIENRALQS